MDDLPFSLLLLCMNIYQFTPIQLYDVCSHETVCWKKTLYTVKLLFVHAITYSRSICLCLKYAK